MIGPFQSEVICKNKNTQQATPGSPEYNEYWGSFIADFATHLKSKGWFEKAMIAMDERPMESMQAVPTLIRKIEPDFKISLAGNYHEPINYEITDFSEGFGPMKEFPESAKAKRKELGSAYGHPFPYMACRRLFRGLSGRPWQHPLL